MKTKSEIYAEIDGIEIKDTEYGRYGYRRSGTKFLIPCEQCGRKVERKIYNPDLHYKCDYCKMKIKKKKKESQNLQNIMSVETKNEKRFRKATDKIKSQVNDFDKYENAIKIAETRAERYGSMPEAMVAIELLKNHHRIIPQQKVGRYKVDFALPQEKIVIEVDGSIYHRDKNNDREAEIQLSLGFDWKIIHIPAELIQENITKLEKIIQTFS